MRRRKSALPRRRFMLSAGVAAAGAAPTWPVRSSGDGNDASGAA